jgi:hypothetical protein
MKGFKNITVREDLALILKIEARRLGYKSIGEYIEELNAVRTKMGWSELDLYCLKTFGKIPEVQQLSQEEYQRLTHEEKEKIPFVQHDVLNFARVDEKGKLHVQTVPLKVTGNIVKKKKEKTKKKRESLRMPTSEQFFKGDK